MYLKLLLLILPFVNVAAQSVTLYADTTDLSADHSPHLTCDHSYDSLVSWWLNGRIALRATVNGEECMTSPTNPPYLADCTCADTVHTCTLKDLAWPNLGDQWACSIEAGNGTDIKSNILTITVPAPKSVNLSADTTDLSAGHSPHLTCSHDYYPIVSWWHNGGIALSSQVNGGDFCLNIPSNPAYLTDCTCAYTVNTCTLKNLNRSNVGDQLACSISTWNGTVIKSNILTLTLPAPKSVTLYADTTDVLNSPHLTCHHDNYSIASWWLNGEIALSAQVSGTDCLNIPTNPAYLTDCTCSYTVHTCTLKSLTRSNIGDQWACSISDWDGTVIKSNILTLTLPVNPNPREERSKTAVIAGSVGGAVGGLIIIVVVVIIWKRKNGSDATGYKKQ